MVHSTRQIRSEISKEGRLTLSLATAPVPDPGPDEVNIMRKPEQAKLLRSQGAQHVVDSSAPTFMADLVVALSETDATLAFDAIGGGPLA